MIISFIWGIIIGVLSGVTAGVLWAAVKAGKKSDEQMEKMEISEIKEVPDPAKEQKPLDITPELVISAYDVIRKYCKQQIGCKFGCPFRGEICEEYFCEKPEDWPELEVTHVQKS